MQGWAIGSKFDSDINVVTYRNNGYTPESIIAYVKSKKQCIYHYVIHHYLSVLYCDDMDKIRGCVSNIFPRISYRHSEYEDQEIRKYWIKIQVTEI